LKGECRHLIREPDSGLKPVFCLDVAESRSICERWWSIVAIALLRAA